MSQLSPRAADVVMDAVLPLPQLNKKNKIRIVYDVSEFFGYGVLLIVTTDIISAFDWPMLTGIPKKGVVLNGISSFWFIKTRHVCPNHFITDDLESPAMPEKLRELLAPYGDLLEGRFMLVKKARTFPAEFIVRRYLLGSAWDSYSKTGMVCGIKLPPGLEKGARLNKLVFTPSTKAGFGEHDVNITFEQLEELFEKEYGPTGKDYAERIRKYSLDLFEYAEDVAADLGLTLQDTKFEFGLLPDGTIILIDELFTPDNSRWTPDYTKQPFRDMLIWTGYDKKGPIIIGLPLVRSTAGNYCRAYEIITGRKI